MTQQQILLKEENNFNIGVDLGLFELTGVYRVWSIVHNVDKSCKNSKDNNQTSDDRINLHKKKCIYD